MNSSSAERFCIIGAGPSGLAAAKELKAKGIPYDHFERHDKVGGIWDLRNPDTPMYESAHFISSKTMSALPGFPFPDNYPDYPSRKQVLEYLQSYADHFDVARNIQFNTIVERVEVTEKDSTVLLKGNAPKTYRGVICATGMNWDPIVPSFKGEFTGEIRHAQTYTSPNEFSNKRVLIVGLGNSGADIASDAATRASDTFVSIRQGYHFIPKHIFGKPADVFAHEGPHLPLWLESIVFGFLLRLLVGNTQRVGMPKPNHKILQTHPLMNDQVLHHLRHGRAKLVPDIDHFENGNSVALKDGTILPDIDLIILATGYRRTISYLDANKYCDDGELAASNFLTCFSRKYDNLFTLGYIEVNGALYPHVGRLSAMVAEYIKSSPEEKKKFRNLVQTSKFDLTGGRKLANSERHWHYCDEHALEKATKRISRKMKWKCP